MGVVIFVNGLTVLFVAVLMGIDAALFRSSARLFAEAAVLCGVPGGLVTLAVWNRTTRFRRVHAFLLTSTVWLSAAVAGAVPFALYGMSPVDAFFEALSGVTTTGSTVMSGLESVPRGLLFWRALLQALGGVGFVVAAMALLPVLRVGGMQLFRTESSDKGEKEFASATRMALATLAIYAGLIGFCAAAYEFGGMSPFDAITHAFTTLSTGGYSNYDASFGHFQSAFLQWAATFFMFLGGIPFMFYMRALTRRRFFNEQVIAMVQALGIVIAVMTIWLILTSSYPLLTALRLVAFNVVSITTTTGYATADYTTWGPFAVAAFFMLTAVGGSTGSTAGGAKAMRWIIMARAIAASLRRVHMPHGVFTIRYEGRNVDEDVLNGVMSFLVLYIATVAVMAAVLTLLGLDFDTAVSGALTSLANVGPGVGPTIGPAGNFASLSDPAKVVLLFGMYVGRLEMFTVYALFIPALWREV